MLASPMADKQGAGLVDTISREYRSEIMSRVGAKDTKPEMVVRRMLHAAGYRYRLHAKDLPGKPDLVFPARRKVVFINGCFWHRHRGCAHARLPKSRTEFWTEKLERNRERDERNVEALRELGWEVLTVWECEVRDPATLMPRVVAFLEQQPAPPH
jgi:DNA mismatch endonuclease (patch repair protein)